jgi:hypothetical protein
MLVEEGIDTDGCTCNLNRFGFIDALDEMHTIFSWIFQQDGAPAHTSQAVLDWLEESFGMAVNWW